MEEIKIEEIKIEDTSTLITTTTTTNNIPKYDNKCIYHPNQDIIYLCSNCDYTPCCSKCAVSEVNHRGHKFDDIDLENTTKIFQQFKSTQYPNLNKCLQTDIELINESNLIFKDIDQQHQDNLIILKNEFQQLHNVIELIEKEATIQLTNYYNSNTQLNISIKNQVDSNSKEIETIVEKHKPIIDTYQVVIDNQTNQHIEIIKHNQISKKLISDNSTKKKQLDQYNNILITFQSLADTIKDSIKYHYYTITSKSVTFKGLKKLTLGHEIFSIYEDGCVITDDITCLAIGVNVNDLSILKNVKNVTSILFLDGYNGTISVNQIPSTVTSLYFGSLNKPLVIGSIPNTVRYLYLLNGFNQETTKGIIPYGIQHLFVGSIKFGLLANSIPSTVKQLYRIPGIPLVISDSKWSGPFGSNPSIWTHPIIKYID